MSYTAYRWALVFSADPGEHESQLRVMEQLERELRSLADRYRLDLRSLETDICW